MVRVSVVMPVYNGAAEIDATLKSIAAQTMGDYEMIVVDDGSTDETPALLAAAAARDRRLRIVRQENAGMTRALIRGCAEAGAEVIARHDCSDTSAPERFARQLDALRDGVVLVSCATRYVGPKGEELYVARAGGDDVRRSLRHDDVRTIRGLPAHPTAMFRRADYFAAGGYRAEFRFAQDLDLWVRMAARGRIIILPDVLYTATYSAGAISATRRDQQIELTRIALQLREQTISEIERARLLAEAAAVGAAARPPRRRDDAAAFHFLASCLRRNGDPRWRGYARSALRCDPLHWRTWLLLLKP
jgi:glycosyltransferase involved in cell wall biosynthesis